MTTSKNIQVNQSVIDFLKKQQLFSTSITDAKGNGETEIFKTLDEAKKHYDSIDVMDFSGIDEKYYWRNNEEGQSAELRVIEELPVSLLEEMNEAETEEEMTDLFMNEDPHHTFSKRIETKYSFLSDDWNEETSERIIKENKVDGITYGTYFGEIALIKLSGII